MFAWFGRKSAPQTRSYVPAWLQGEREQGGFVRAMEDMSAADRASGNVLVRRGGAWETGIVHAQEVHIDGLTVLRNRQPAIADPAGGSVTDAECRSAAASILAALRTHGMIA